MNSPHYDWSKVSPETAQKVLQAAHDFNAAVSGLTSNLFIAAMEAARKEAAIYEITAAEAHVLAAALSYFRARRNRSEIRIGELSLATRMDIEEGCLNEFFEACAKLEAK